MYVRNFSVNYSWLTSSVFPIISNNERGGWDFAEPLTYVSSGEENCHLIPLPPLLMP